MTAGAILSAPLPHSEPHIPYIWTVCSCMNTAPGVFDHGGMIHWIPLPGTELAGHILTVSAPSAKTDSSGGRLQRSDPPLPQRQCCRRDTFRGYFCCLPFSSVYCP